jgi:hypothetical protein
LVSNYIADPDPAFWTIFGCGSGSMVLATKNRTILQLKIIVFLKIKIGNLFIPRHPLRAFKLQEKRQPSKENILQLKI